MSYKSHRWPRSRALTPEPRPPGPPFLVRTQRGCQNWGEKFQAGHCQGPAPPTSNVLGLSLSRTPGSVDEEEREEGGQSSGGAGRARGKGARCPPLCPGAHSGQHVCRYSGGCAQGTPRGAVGSFLTLTRARFLGRRAEKTAGGESAQGTTCHHLKGKGFRSTLVPQWISPSSWW